MPKYEYICEECGFTFEERVIKFEPKKDCPKCLSEDALKQLYKPPTVVYKGAGFYTTESRGITGNTRRKRKSIRW